MLPPKEGILWNDDPEVIGLSEQNGTSEGRSSSSGISGMRGSSTSHANSRMVSDSENESSSASFSSADTSGLSKSEGWSSGWTEGYGIAETQGESEAWARGTNRSITTGTTVTNSESVTDGYSDTVGKTFTRGTGFTEGETITHGESVTMSPFYEYRREEIETPTFLTPEEQKLLVMQKLACIPKMHFLVKAPESKDCIIRAPYVPDPIITKRLLAAGLQYVYSALPCYTTLAQHDNENEVAPPGTGDAARHGDDDVIDAEVREVRKPKRARALPSPAPADAETEAALWERVKLMSHGAHALPSPTPDDTDDEPVFWRPATQRNARQEKS
jgi:hypothetical protein